jgi:hypothetical protein
MRPEKNTHKTDAPTSKNGAFYVTSDQRCDILHWFQCGSGLSFLGHCRSGYGSAFSSGSRILMTKNWQKFTDEIFFYFLIHNCNLLIARLPQKRTSSTSKHEIFPLSSIFGGIFALLELDTDPHPNADPDLTDYNQCGSMQIRIQQTKINADPCRSGSATILLARCTGTSEVQPIKEKGKRWYKNLLERLLIRFICKFGSGS